MGKIHLQKVSLTALFVVVLSWHSVKVPAYNIAKPLPKDFIAELDALGLSKKNRNLLEVARQKNLFQDSKYSCIGQVILEETLMNIKFFIVFSIAIVYVIFSIVVPFNRLVNIIPAVATVFSGLIGYSIFYALYKKYSNFNITMWTNTGLFIVKKGNLTFIKKDQIESAQFVPVMYNGIFGKSFLRIMEKDGNYTDVSFTDCVSEFAFDKLCKIILSDIESMKTKGSSDADKLTS